MALSGYSRVAVTNQNTLVLAWAAVQSTAGNRSTVSWELRLEAGAYGRIDAAPGSAWEVILDGKTFSGTTCVAIGNNQTVVLASGSAVLEHDANGERYFTYTFRQDFHINFGGSYVGTVTGAGEAQLDTIARASRPVVPVSRVELGSPVTISIESAGDFTHTLEYSFGKASGVIAQGVRDSAQWIPAISLARQIPDATEGTAAVRCKTFQGDTLLGTRELTLSLAVPETVVPSQKTTIVDSTGAMEILGVALQNYSKFQVKVVTAGAQGSTVTGTQVLLDGQPYKGGTVSQTGAVTVTVTVTDSRGRTSSRDYSLDIAPYWRPAVTVSASRCNAQSEPDDTGEYAKITVTGSTAPVSGNQPGLTLTWGWEQETLEPEQGNFTLVRLVPADSGSTLDIRAELRDSVCGSTDTMTLSTGYATLDLLQGGKGLALGKSATREGFDCAMSAWFARGINGIGLGLLGETPVTGPVLAGVTDGLRWGFYLVPVDGERMDTPVRITGELDAAFALENGCLTVEGFHVTGWVMGLAA